MGTLVCFHAHPDDESIQTAGVMARAADQGHRVVLVVATRGEHGEIVPGVLAEGEALADRRVEETQRSAAVLGVARVEFLGYVDSGMAGTPENDGRGAFWRADVEEAAGRLARLLAEERADVLTVYDERGGYGHPDHIQVHRVGVRAAELAGTARVYEATLNRDEMVRQMAEAREAGALPEGMELPDPAEMEMGVPEERLTTRVDVAPWLDRKRAAMRAHASQIAETSFFLAMPDEAFTGAFGVEWFIRRGGERPEGGWETDIMAGLA